MAPSQDPTGLPQRQSCDRCHKQKLRCTRDNTEEEGTCDRCYRKRARCVYSSSLPKGRPKTTVNTEIARRRSSEACTPPEVAPLSAFDDVDMTAFADAASIDANHDISPTRLSGSAPDGIVATTQTGTNGLADASMEHSRPDMEQWLMPFNWNDTQSATNWNRIGSVHLDGPSASLVSYPGNNTPVTTFAGTQPSVHLPITTGPSSNHAYIQSEANSMQGSSENSKLRLHESKLSAGMGGKSMVTVGQLAQLTMRLSSLRHQSTDLARTAAAPFTGSAEVTRSSLVDSPAFESVVAWLGRDDIAGGTTDQNSHAPQCAGMCMATTSSCGEGILHETFSASHLLLNILRNLQAEQTDRTTSMILGAMLSPAPTAGHGYFDIPQNLGVGVLNSGESMTAQARSNTSIRHLVMVCNTLLLEIYLAILIALQHDAYLSIHENKIMKSVRMDLIVQLCSHLIDRQCQALDLYQSSLHPPISTDESSINVDRSILTDLKRQVHDRLHQLRQVLRCAN